MRSHARLIPGITLLVFLLNVPFFTGCGSSYEGEHSFSSFNYPESFIRHRNSEGWITIVESELDMKDASFRIVPGLADKTCWSFESVNYPGHYLRHYNSKILLNAIVTNDSLGAEDATFRIVKGLADSSFVSFESLNYPGHYIRHQNSRLSIAKMETNDLFMADATFKIEPTKATNP